MLATVAPTMIENSGTRCPDDLYVKATPKLTTTATSATPTATMLDKR